MKNDEVENPDVEVSESEDEDVKLTEPSKTSIYNADGLLDKLDDIRWPQNVEWIHKLSLDINQEQKVDVNDDLARELAFYTQALEGTRQAFVKFQSMQLPFLRPPDYYAEMVKSDSHMVKVKGRLLAEKRKMEEADERRKARESKKIAKEVQAQKLKERAKNKKDEIESVKKWRKQRQQSGFARGDKDGDMGLSFEDGKSFEKSNKKRPGVAPFDRTGGKGGRGGAGKGKGGGAAGGKRKGRDVKDSKFGFGGRKGMEKQNTAETTNDFRSFNQGGSSGNKKRKR
ncbi:probable rRNA-processing protein EBP2 homolog [Rhododendron vialii]|uniref:probable rRNA-processing protein EBP2 homolog n=1 Tax=Rhododendron vialii TaxID=182163 RepID=UPI00265DFCC3|nr:probable rRNA-processing protein EBP2 homolog [Rhododendron vialii]XP_058224892.1 probable rRNA-processing protein EBP2 homolog [Rhododendron vialii]